MQRGFLLGQSFDEFWNLRFVRIPDNPGHTRQHAQFLRSALGVTARNDDANMGIALVQLSNRIARLGVGGGGYCAGVYDHDVGSRCFRGRDAATLEKLPFQRRAVGLGGTTAKLLDVKSRHENSIKT
jgi:hypothetical protein